MNSHANDALIRKYENELEERNSFIQGLLANVADAGRDLNESEKESLASTRDRIKEIQVQLNELEATADIAKTVANRAKEIDQSITTSRRDGSRGPVEYRSAGEYLVDSYNAMRGDRSSAERLEVYHRAAAHQKTPDNLGVIPDPIVGPVINYIDAQRPLVNAIGPKDLPAATFYLPIVTQQPSVAVQGSAGAAADEKAELVSQKMLISRLTVNAVTYGGYVNVSRQNIDFSSPPIMDTVVDGLAAQYAIVTEAAVGTKLDASTGTPVGYGASPTAATITAAVWAVAATVFTAVKGQGRLILALAPDRLAVFGPLFPPINPQGSQSQGLFAGNFNQGEVGGVSGIQVVMSAGLASGKAFLFSTAAIDVFEQRVGTMSIAEPSVMGVQVGYAGYFTSVIKSNNGIIELTAS